jgi:short-subunit dehydrogenase involved in D-alanine esterification of teichoic acids
MHFFTMAQRTQLKNTKIRVVEIAPPAVGTDLHRDREDPDDNKKHKNPTALTVEEFMEELVQGWKQDDDLITAGPGNALVKTWQESIGVKYEPIAEKYQPK